MNKHLFGATQESIEQAGLRRFLPLLLVRICGDNYLGHTASTLANSSAIIRL